VVLRGTVVNTGERDGSDVVQVYGGLRGDRRRLLGFVRVHVPAGAKADAEARLPLDRFARRDPAARRSVVMPGTYELRVARTATDPGSGPMTLDVP